MQAVRLFVRAKYRSVLDPSARIPAASWQGDSRGAPCASCYSGCSTAWALPGGTSSSPPWSLAATTVLGVEHEGVVQHELLARPTSSIFTTAVRKPRWRQAAPFMSSPCHARFPAGKRHGQRDHRAARHPDAEGGGTRPRAGAIGRHLVSGVPASCCCRAWRSALPRFAQPALSDARRDHRACCRPTTERLVDVVLYRQPRRGTIVPTSAALPGLLRPFRPPGRWRRLSGLRRSSLQGLLLQ